MLTSTTPALPALSDYNLRSQHTPPCGSDTQRLITHILSALPHRSLCARYAPPWLLSLWVLRRKVGLLCTAGTHGGDGNPRTQCHFTMQAHALRVPDSCDDHTAPSCLVANSLCGAKVSVCANMGRFPDPSLTQWSLVTFLACALHQLFARSCDLAHHGLYCTHVCAYTPQLVAASPFSVFAFAVFSCSHGRKHQNMRLRHGTEGWNHSYYTGISHTLSNSYYMVRPHRLLCRFLASTREPHGAATAGSVSCAQVTHSAISPQVQTGPTRTATSDLLSATVAGAATQLSFAEFSERCILLRVSPPPPLPTPTLLLGCNYADYSTHRLLTRRLHLTPALGALSQMYPPASSLGGLGSVRCVPDPPLRYSQTRLCRLLRAVLHLPMPPPNFRSRSSSSSASTPMTL